MCMCVHDFLSFLIDAPFSHLPFVHVHFHLPFCFNIIFSASDQGVSIVNPIVLPFQKICGNCHIAGVIIFPISSVHYNVCR
jgi:hypothetical protein